MIIFHSYVSLPEGNHIKSHKFVGENPSNPSRGCAGCELRSIGKAHRFGTGAVFCLARRVWVSNCDLTENSLFGKCECLLMVG